MTRPHRFGTRAAVLAAWVTVLGLPLAAQNPRERHNAGVETFTKRVVASGLSDPWEVVWGPDGWLWVTERTAFRVTRINPADGSARVALTLTDAYQTVVQDGLLGLALHPDLLQGRDRDFVYLAYTYDRDPGPDVVRRLRIRRYTYDARTQSLGAPQDVLDNLPAHDDHGAGRVVVGPDGALYVSRGDQGSNFLQNYCNPNRAQELPTAEAVQARDWNAYQGKILRMNLDGSIPNDNPVIGGVRSHIWAWGLRNPQGLAFAPGGALYASDHGPSTDDELDRIVAGRNYGWPHVAGFKDDRSYVYANWSASSPTPCRELKFDNLHPPASVPQATESSWSHPDFVPPLATLFTAPPGYDIDRLGSTTVAPSGLAVYASSAIPGWATSLLVTGMRAGAVYRVRLAPDGVTASGEPVEYFRSANRFRGVTVSPDGLRIFVTTDSFGSTSDPGGARTSRLSDPGALIEFTFTGAAAPAVTATRP